MKAFLNNLSPVQYSTFRLITIALLYALYSATLYSGITTFFHPGRIVVTIMAFWVLVGLTWLFITHCPRVRNRVKGF